MEALSNNTLDVSQKTAPKVTKMAGIMFSYGKARSSSTALLDTGVSVIGKGAGMPDEPGEDANENHVEERRTHALPKSSAW